MSRRGKREENSSHTHEERVLISSELTSLSEVVLVGFVHWRLVCSLRRQIVVPAPNEWFPQNARLWQQVNAARLGSSHGEASTKTSRLTFWDRWPSTLKFFAPVFSAAYRGFSLPALWKSPCHGPAGKLCLRPAPSS